MHHFMKVLGYIRVSTDHQDLSKQKHLLLEYSQQQRLISDEFVEVEISSRRSAKERRIDELLSKLEAGDRLLVAELSRLGRNMLETLNIINQLSEKEINITIIRQIAAGDLQLLCRSRAGIQFCSHQGRTGRCQSSGQAVRETKGESE
jgi:DNA invertase Pin-like site-specific DNA recombinase